MTVLSPSDWLKQPDTLIVAQGIDTQPRLLSNLLDSQSCFHAISIEPGVDSRSRGHAILKETRHHGSSPVVLIRPGKCHNSSRQNQDNTQRQRNYIERKISNK